VLKCGGGKALTKQTADEAVLKCHLTIEEANKVVEDNAVVICDAQASPELESELEVTAIRTGINSKSNGLGKIMLELYDLEDCVESKKPVKIDLDLDLYQMEKV
jgi:hypothetical protein